MEHSRILWRVLQASAAQTIRPRIQCQSTRFISSSSKPHLQTSRYQASRDTRSIHGRRRYATQQPADDPSFTSIVDAPPVMIRIKRKHNIAGLMLLAAMPIISFGLGCWQVQRLGWKTDLIAKFEDRLIREPLPLPPRVDPEAVKEFDYRRVYARGKLLHDQEMLIGPRLNDGQDGYLVITPLDRSAEFPASMGNTKVLVNRGWISKEKADKSSRPEGLPTGEVEVQGLLREPWKKNSFTPKNDLEKGNFHFPDVHELAEHTGSQPIWIEETMPSDLVTAYQREDKGIPIGRPAEVNLRNNHAQYIFTWFSLSIATSVMLWMILKRPVGGVQRRIRQSRSG